MSIITEIKRKAEPNEFAALIMPDAFGLHNNVSGLYLEITKAGYERLRAHVKQMEGNRGEGRADEFFKRMTLLDASVSDSDQLMLLVGTSKFKAIPPIEENVLTVLDEGASVVWKLDLHGNGDNPGVVIFGDGAETGEISFSFYTARFALERFDPDKMKKEFFMN